MLDSKLDEKKLTECECVTVGVCEPRCMKLKEAEKTIANKDVIIKMLQEHVKKLEASYRENLKETEKFRYKFFLASEQMKRLRCGGCVSREKCDTEKLKELKCDLNKWKEQKSVIDKSSSEFSGKCKYLEQLTNMENFMKAHYELLQALVDKVLKQKSNGSNDVESVEMSMKHDEEISKLKQEIARLREENENLLKRQNKTEVFSTKSGEICKKQCRRSTQDSNIINSTVEKLPSSKDLAGENLRKVNFSSTGVSPTHIVSRESYLNDLNSSLSVQNRKEEIFDIYSASEKKSTEKLLEATISDAKVIKPSEISLQRSTQQFKTTDTEEVKNVKSRSGSNLLQSQSKLTEQQSVALKKSQQEILASSLNLPKNSVTCLCYKRKGNQENLKNCIYSSTGLAEKNGSPSNLNGQQSNTSKQEITPEESEANIYEECASASKDLEKNICSCEKIGENTSNLYQPSKTSTKETSEQKQVVSKLCDISDRVELLLQNQQSTSKELQTLRSQLSVSQENTQQCSECISKLADTLDLQKNTFLQKFEEQKIITNNLAATNDGIQQELCDIRSNIDQLYKDISELKHNSDVSAENSTHMSVPRDVSTSNQCQGCHPQPKLPEANCQCPEEKKDEMSQVEIVTDDDLDALEKINEQKDKEIESMNNLITCYQKATAHISAISNLDCGKCNCDSDDIETYLNKVRYENIKMKTTISSVINHLSEKMTELQNSETDQNSCTYFDEATVPEDSSVSKIPVVKSDLEIEDIYNAIKKSCGCNKKDRPSAVNSQTDSEDYKCVFCACSSQSSFCELHTEVKKSCAAKCDAGSSLHETDSMSKTMEVYIQYLHEQLDTINSIENRIEDLRHHVQN